MLKSDALNAERVSKEVETFKELEEKVFDDVQIFGCTIEFAFF